MRISSAVLYTKGFRPRYPFEVTRDTVVLYQLEDGKGNRTQDLSRNKNHGLIFGAKWVKLEPKPGG